MSTDLLTPSEEAAARGVIAHGDILESEDAAALIATLDARIAMLEGHLAEADEALAGRLGRCWEAGQTRESARAERILAACQEYVAAEDALPPEHGEGDEEYCLSKYVEWEVKRANEAEALLRNCLDCRVLVCDEHEPDDNAEEDCSVCDLLRRLRDAVGDDR
jgi:hypothetical protein